MEKLPKDVKSFKTPHQALRRPLSQKPRLLTADRRLTTVTGSKSLVQKPEVSPSVAWSRAKASRETKFFCLGLQCRFFMTTAKLVL